jgi:hypothetical protein
MSTHRLSNTPDGPEERTRAADEAAERDEDEYALADLLAEFDADDSNYWEDENDY